MRIRGFTDQLSRRSVCQPQILTPPHPFLFLCLPFSSSVLSYICVVKFLLCNPFSSFYTTLSIPYFPCFCSALSPTSSLSVCSIILSIHPSDPVLYPPFLPLSLSCQEDQFSALGSADPGVISERGGGGGGGGGMTITSGTGVSSSGVSSSSFPWNGVVPPLPPPHLHFSQNGELCGNRASSPVTATTVTGTTATATSGPGIEEGGAGQQQPEPNWKEDSNNQQAFPCLDAVSLAFLLQRQNLTFFAHFQCQRQREWRTRGRHTLHTVYTHI